MRSRACRAARPTRRAASSACAGPSRRVACARPRAARIAGTGARSPPAFRSERQRSSAPAATAPSARTTIRSRRSSEPLLTRERRIEPKGRGRLEAGRVEEEPGECCEPRERAVGGEHVDARAEQRRDGHDEALAQVVDRGIRHLREALSKVGRERTGTAGQRRDRRVVAHRRDRIVAGLGERAEHRVELLAGVAVEDVTRVQSALGRCDRLARVGGDDARGHPPAVRMPTGQFTPQLVAEQQPARRVDDEDPAGPEPGAPHTRTVRERTAPASDATVTRSVIGDGDAKRPQPVAIERGTARPAVGEAERGRPVPRLAEHRAVAVEVAHVRIEPRVVLPRRRDEERDASARSLSCPRTTRSRALSRSAESDPAWSSAGARPGSTSCDRSRASIHATLPSIVLISPLWQRSRNGCARSQLGSVFVEKR